MTPSIDSLKSGDKIYISSQHERKLRIVTFIGFNMVSGSKWAVVYDHINDIGYYHTKPETIQLMSQVWWVPVFKEQEDHTPYEIGKTHFSTRQACNEAWGNNKYYLGAVRVDKNAGKISDEIG